MTINNYQETIIHSMAFIHDDFTELWVIVNKIHNENPMLSFPQLVEATRNVVSDLVENYGAHLVNEHTKQPEKLNRNEILNIVEGKMMELNRIPNIGDGVWFTI